MVANAEGILFAQHPSMVDGSGGGTFAYIVANNFKGSHGEKITYNPTAVNAAVLSLRAVQY